MRNIVEVGMPGSENETVRTYLKQIFHVFDYYGDDTTFIKRLYMPDYKPQIVLLDDNAKPHVFH